MIAIDVRERHPADACIAANAHALARYAALCVEQGLVPIVEPEVLMDGNHTIEDCYAATERTLQWVYSELYRQRVPLEQVVLKPNMALSGSECHEQAGAAEIAVATANLNEINRGGKECPWKLSFSYGLAFQAFYHRAKLNGAACLGTYEPAMEAT